MMWKAILKYVAKGAIRLAKEHPELVREAAGAIAGAIDKKKKTT